MPRHSNTKIVTYGSESEHSRLTVQSIVLKCISAPFVGGAETAPLVEAEIGPMLASHSMRTFWKASGESSS